MTMSRRRILATGAALAAASAAGCSSSSPGTAGASAGGAGAGNQALRLTRWGNELRNRLTRQFFDLLLKRHPSIKVSMEPGEWGSYWDKLATQVAGTNMPDICQHDESQIAAYATKNTLLELTTQKALDLSSVDPKVLDTGKVAGTVYGVPVGIAGFSVAVNPAVLAQAGVALPKDKTWTWDEMVAAAAQVSAKVPGSYGFDGFGTGSAELVYWARQSGQAVFPQGGETAMTAETVATYYAVAQKMIETKAVPPVTVQVENGAKPIDGSLFGTGKAAFHLLFHTQVQAFASAAKTDLTLLRLPAIKTRAWLRSIHEGGCILRKTRAGTERCLPWVLQGTRRLQGSARRNERGQVPARTRVSARHNMNNKFANITHARAAKLDSRDRKAASSSLDRHSVDGAESTAACTGTAPQK